jgi:hypothetical protein
MPFGAWICVSVTPSFRPCAVTGVTCAAPPTRPFPRPGLGRQEAGHSPVGSDVSWTLGSPAVRSPGTTIGSAASYEQPASIVAYWAAPSLPDAVGARRQSETGIKNITSHNTNTPGAVVCSQCPTESGVNLKPVSRASGLPVDCAIDPDRAGRLHNRQVSIHIGRRPRNRPLSVAFQPKSRTWGSIAAVCARSVM